MPELNRAIVIGGFSESHEFMWGLTNAVSNSGIAEKVDDLTFAEAEEMPDLLVSEAANSIIIAHSIGAKCVTEAGVFAALNGVEPTPMLKTAWRALKVFTNDEIGRDKENTHKTGRLDGPWEVAKHPSTLSALLATRKFSTVQHMIDGGTERFPGGRIYLPTDKDEFRFGSGDEVLRAREAGIVAHSLEGWHNQPLLHPVESVATIKRIIEQEL